MSELTPDDLHTTGADENNEHLFISNILHSVLAVKYNKKISKGQLLNIEENTSPQPTPEATFDGNATKGIVTAPGGSVKNNVNDNLE